MSNFKYNGTPINNIIYGSNATNTNNLNAYFVNMAISTNPSGNNHSNINSKPNTFNYSIAGTDITTYSIATFTEHGGGGATSTIPSWCKNIRAVLVGGGGGSQGSYIPANNQHDTYSNNSGYNSQYGATNKFYRNYESHLHRTYAGYGGGGGGFIYISSMNVTGYQSFYVSCGGGGNAASWGGNTTLTIVKNNQTSTFTAGGGGGNAEAGGIAVTNNIGAGVHSANGQVGAGPQNIGGLYEVKYQGGIQQSQYTTSIGGGGGQDGSININPQTKNHGLGWGNGIYANNSYSEVVGGNVGNQGFFRIYYLT